MSGIELHHSLAMLPVQPVWGATIRAAHNRRILADSATIMR
jgi:hypothetical protein